MSGSVGEWVRVCVVCVFGARSSQEQKADYSKIEMKEIL